MTCPRFVVVVVDRERHALPPEQIGGRMTLCELPEYVSWDRRGFVASPAMRAAVIECGGCRSEADAISALWPALKPGGAVSAGTDVR